MFSVVFLQASTLLVATFLAGWFVGVPAAVSVALGGGAYLVPNLLFALRLWVAASRSGKPNPLSFFIGEIVKIAATIGLLAVAARSYAALSWPALLIGLVVALQAPYLQLLLPKNLFAFWKKP